MHYFKDFALTLKSPYKAWEESTLLIRVFPSASTFFLVHSFVSLSAGQIQRACLWLWGGFLSCLTREDHYRSWADACKTSPPSCKSSTQQPKNNSCGTSKLLIKSQLLFHLHMVCRKHKLNAQYQPNHDSARTVSTVIMVCISSHLVCLLITADVAAYFNTFLHLNDV